MLFSKGFKCLKVKANEVILLNNTIMSPNIKDLQTINLFTGLYKSN